MCSVGDRFIPSAWGKLSKNIPSKADLQGLYQRDFIVLFSLPERKLQRNSPRENTAIPVMVCIGFPVFHRNEEKTSLLSEPSRSPAAISPLQWVQQHRKAFHLASVQIMPRTLLPWLHLFPTYCQVVILKVLFFPSFLRNAINKWNQRKMRSL